MSIIGPQFQWPERLDNRRGDFDQVLLDGNAICSEFATGLPPK
ncbi:hypothetical protein KIPB_014471, partial [Kipferlia bialata]|eukprot:g14471.t1